MAIVLEGKRRRSISEARTGRLPSNDPPANARKDVTNVQPRIRGQAFVAAGRRQTDSRGSAAQAPDAGERCRIPEGCVGGRDINRLSASDAVLVRPIAMVQRYARRRHGTVECCASAQRGGARRGQYSEGRLEVAGLLARVDAATGRRSLSATYDAEMADLFTLQDAMGESLATALEVDAAKRRPLVEDRPTNRMAYELFLRAADRLSRLNQWDTRAAIDMLHSAVRLDARFAAAWARLAEAHLLMAFTFGEGSRGSPRRSVRLDARFHWIHPTRSRNARTGSCYGRRRAVFRTRRRSAPCRSRLKLNPNNLTARLWQALILLHVGLFDAAEEHLKSR